MGKRLEVWWETPEGGAWHAGYAKGISRARGLRIEYDDGDKEAHWDIGQATEGEVWRREVGGAAR